MIEIEGQWTKDILVQGTVAIASGIIIFGALFLPWLSTNSAISGLTHAEGHAQIAIPMTLILLAILIIF
ncbi:hypothetical protein GTO27_04205, partial [Candidatus Bathyarchaeota archaeon]|nr:hypothetical protein [Candidatus Bathyarchaeota archaeon]